MTAMQETHTPAVAFLRNDEAAKSLKFSGNNGFQVELRRRVEEYFERTGVRQRDCWQMYLKTAVFLALFVGSYALLVFVATAWWQAVPLAILLGLVTAGIGFNVQHDAGHQGFSQTRWVNKLMAMMLDVMGGSSYLWHWKHGVFHHTYVNITGHDTDIDLGAVARLTPHQKYRWFHRWQHFYIWPLYGIMAIRWQLYGDFAEVLRGRIGEHRFPRPRGWELALFVTGKVCFLALAFGIPLLFHSWWVVLLYYGLVSLVVGIVLSIVFQLAHAVGEAGFPLPRQETGRIENAWAVHQVETTVDFARRSSIVSWLLGGLNFQIEHHLLPRVCHVNYPALSPLVEKTCREFGVKFTEHRSFWSGMASHFRWLRQMGVPPAETGAARTTPHPV